MLDRVAGIVEAERMTRAEGWRYDLELLEREIRRVHYAPFRSVPSAELTATMRRLERSVVRLSDDQMAVEIMRLMRRFGDGHTFAEPDWQERETVPVLVGLFDDGLWVTAAAPGSMTCGIALPSALSCGGIERASMSNGRSPSWPPTSGTSM